MDNIIQAQLSLERHLLDNLVYRDTFRNPKGWHASSSGVCIRKVIIEHAINNDLLEHLPNAQAHLDAANAKFKNVEFAGLMNIGHREHTRLQTIWEAEGRLVYGSDLLTADDPRIVRTKTVIGDPEIRHIVVNGTPDCFLNNLLQDNRDLAVQVDIKTGSDAKIGILAKDTVETKIPFHSESKFRVAQPGIKEASQVTCYMMGMPPEWKAKLHPDSWICYFPKSTQLLYWAKAKLKDWTEFVTDYWMNVLDAHELFIMKGELPSPKPIERWECAWARGKKKCSYHTLCFPNAGKNPRDKTEKKIKKDVLADRKAVEDSFKD